MRKLTMEWVSIAEKIWKDVKHNDPRYRRGRISLPLKQRISLSVGHVFSDLCYIVWCTYLLLYFSKVVGLSTADAGYLFVIAQVSDALLTPFIEISIDRVFRNYYPSYGKRKLFHLLGTFIVFLSWPLIFSRCLLCHDDSPQSAKLGYYGVAVVFLHMGWSIIRVSHVSLMPDIVQKQEEVAELNAIRSGLSLACGVFVFCTTWILLGQSDGRRVTPALEDDFMTLSLVIVGFGFVFSFVFHWGTNEPTPRDRETSTRGDLKIVRHKASSRDLYVLRRYTENSLEYLSQQADAGSSTRSPGSISENEPSARSWRQWLNDPDFYKVAVVYTCSRVVINVVQFYFILYVTDALEFSKESIAYFPLVLLITEVFVNTLVKNIRKVLGNKWTFCAAALVILQSCIWLQLQSQHGKTFVFLSAIMMGSSSSIMMTTSLIMLTELANKDKGSSEFIYSAFGFFEKIFVAVIIIIIQSNYPNVSVSGSCHDCADYARLVFTLTPAIVTIIALIMVMFGFRTTVVISCSDIAGQEDHCTQTDMDADPPAESLYTVNEENADTASLQHYDVANQTSGILKIKSTHSQSDPVLTILRRKGGSALPLLESFHTSVSSVCKTMEGVPLIAEKVVVFSYDSFVAGGVSARSSSSEQLQHLVESVDVDEPPEGHSSEKEMEPVCPVHMYKQMSSLRSTDL